MTDVHDVVQQHTERFLRGEGNPTEIVSHLESMSPSELTSLLPTLFATGTIGAHHQALRDTINAVLYRKLSDSLIGSIGALDRSTGRLTKVGWVLTVVVGIVGAVVSWLVAAR